MNIERVTLKGLKVRDLRRLLIENPAVVPLGTSLTEALEKLLEDPRVRHVYVVDAQERLVGVVRMHQLVRWLFPWAVLYECDAELPFGRLPDFDATVVDDIMLEAPLFLEEEDEVDRVAELLLQGGVNELPVVDARRKLVGQLSVYEVFSAYLKALRQAEHARSV